MPSIRFPGSAPAPDGLPAPRRFAHLYPEDGACLMEAASVLAGGRFTDSPSGTHPVLAALARVVNDSVGDHARQELWPLAADLAHACPPGRDYAPRLINSALEAALQVRPGSRVLRVRCAACRHRAGRLAHADAHARTPAWLANLSDTLWWRGPGRHHLEHALRVLWRAPDAEERLPRLLSNAVADALAEPHEPGRAPASAQGATEPSPVRPVVGNRTGR
ncbi:hypothetical protein [Streptomyces sp. NPDC046261]|uniref:hypothetical protein n=1 Tax=Streptomyces sp. NPDC046261 TaxID=3157200 RepID=UPI0033FE5730